MGVLGYALLAGLVCCLALPFLHAWAWCLADLRHHATLDASARARWLGALLLMSVLAVPMYVGTGPGRERWNPRMLWWPWKR